MLTTISLFIFLNFSSISHCALVKQWFGSSYPKNPCRVLGIRLNLLNLGDGAKSIDREVDELFQNSLRNLNCTYMYKVATLRILETPDENGTYNGLFGYIQRNEYDIALFPVRTDLIVGDPVKIGPAVASGDSLIVAGYTEPENSTNTISSMVFIFKQEVYYFYLITIHFFVVLMVGTIYFLQPLVRRGTFTSRLGKNNWKLSLFLCRYYLVARKLLMCLLGSESLEPVTVTVKVIAIVLLTANLFLFEGFFKNLIKSEAVSKRPHVMIQSLDDILYNPLFNSSIRPVFVRQLYLSSLLEDENCQLPKYKVLRRKVAENFNDSSILLNFDEPIALLDQINNVLIRVIANQAALILPVSLNKDQIFDKYFCPHDPEKSRKLRVADQPILSGCTLNMVYSKKIDHSFERFANYKYNTFIEFGMLSAFARNLQTAPSYEGYEFTGKHATCSLKIHILRLKEEEQHKIVEYEPFSLTFFAPLFQQCCYFFVTIVLVLKLELLSNSSKKPKRVLAKRRHRTVHF